MAVSLEVLEQSLFDKEVRRRDASGSGNLMVLTQVVLVMRFGPGTTDLAQFAEFYEEAVKEAAGPEGLTGLLMVFPKYALHVVEGTTDITAPLLRHCQLLQERNEIDAARVLLTRQLLERSFGTHSYTVLNLASKVVEYKTSDPLETVVAECILSTSSISAMLRALPPHQYQETLDNLHVKAADVLISQGMLEYLVEQDMLDDPSSWLERYETVNEPVLDNDVVFPISARLFPYE